MVREEKAGTLVWRLNNVKGDFLPFRPCENSGFFLCRGAHGM